MLCLYPLSVALSHLVKWSQIIYLFIPDISGSFQKIYNQSSLKAFILGTCGHLLESHYTTKFGTNMILDL